MFALSVKLQLFAMKCAFLLKKLWKNTFVRYYQWLRVKFGEIFRGLFWYMVNGKMESYPNIINIEAVSF